MVTSPIERDKKIFDLGVEYLTSFDGIDDVEQYITQPTVSFPDDMHDIFRRMVITAQNYQSMPNIIGRAIDGIDNLAPILADFSPDEVVRMYGMDSVLLLDRIVKELNPRGSVNRTSRSSWPKFCRSVLDGAEFLSQFKDAQDFYDWCNFFDNDSRARVALPLLISEEIYGLGFTLACDFIKELGYLNFGKPDVHIKGVFLALELSQDENDLEIFKSLQRMAKSTGKTVFAIDKLFWIIGADTLKVGSSREAFIDFALDNLNAR